VLRGTAVHTSSSTKFSTHVYYSSVDRLFAHQLIIEILAHAHLISIEILDQSFARAVYSCVVDSCILLVEYILPYCTFDSSKIVDVGTLSFR
jgi:hypothetical protein